MARRRRLGVVLAAAAMASATPTQSPGRCAMYSTCGKVGFFGQELPCPDNREAPKVDALLRAEVEGVCGSDFASSLDSACCTNAQVEALAMNLAQAEPLIATCPACRNNFRRFYCHFTCSPDQSLFVNVTDTQRAKDDDGKEHDAVAELDFYVDPRFGEGFFESCREVKFGATNGYAMDLIGGGAKAWGAFLRYMGEKRPGLGSPFQINFPDAPAHAFRPLELASNGTFSPLNPNPLSCSAASLDARCACPDCSSVCTSLPDPPAPFIAPSTCKVGELECVSFVIVLVYSILLLACLGLAIRREVVPRKRIRLPNDESGYESAGGYERVSMHDGPTLGSDDDAAAADAGSRSAGSTNSSFSNRRQPQRASDHDFRAVRARHQPRTYPPNTYFTRAFYRLGHVCASKPYLTIAVGLAICALLNAGWARFEVERDPVRLWVSKGSKSEIEKADFDHNFGPFYRTQQIFFTSAADPNEPVLTWDRLRWIAQFEEQVRDLQSPHNLSLASVCFAPTSDVQPPKSATPCVVQSIMGYFDNTLDGSSEAKWAATLDSCATNPAACLPPFGQPLNPRLLVGGVPGYSGRPDDPAGGTVHASQARSVVLTYVVNNSLNRTDVARAAEWESTLKDFLSETAAPRGRAELEAGLKMAWSTEVSLEEELNKSTNTDVPIVILSYLVMFLYVSINLGGSGAALLSAASQGGKAVLRLVMPTRFARSASLTTPIFLSSDEDDLQARRPSLRRRLLVESKFVLALWSIVIVLLSVSTSVGLFSLLGVKITLIIAEVIPFLVLAIGVDNVFILAHELARQNSRAHAAFIRSGAGFASGGGGGGYAVDEEDEEDEVGGLPSPEERVAKALGRMGPSILLSASCETVAFALGAIVGMPAVRNFAIYAAGAVAINTLLQITILVSAMAIDLRRVESNRVDCVPCIKIPARLGHGGPQREGRLNAFIRTCYAPALLKKPVKIFVLVFFSALFVLSLVGSRYISLGLDQRLALPSESYLVDYFDALDTYLDVGPPVYFISEGLNATSRGGQQAVCGRFTTCSELSLANVLEAERKRPNSSYIAQPPAVWVDDFMQWLNPLLEACCRVRKRDPSVFCEPGESSALCRPCFEDADPAWDITMEGFPQGAEFMRYLDQWIDSPTDEDCPLGGKAPYSTAIAYTNRSVTASHFRTYHTPLKTQDDFINAMAAARRIADDLSSRTRSRVYPYSIFYVFFDQYSRIEATAREVLFLALAAVFVVSSLFLGSWRCGGLVSIAVLMTILNVLGVMGPWSISLNAVSLVNLVISVGIGVEFCAHVARAFMGAAGGGLPQKHAQGQRDRDERAWAALVDVGGSVFSGIFSTKIIGIAVLGLTRSKLLETYYFRMWLTLIVSGALHGLVFLPVALSYFGGQGYAIEHDDDDLAGMVRARYEEDQRRPFLGGRAGGAGGDDSDEEDD